MSRGFCAAAIIGRDAAPDAGHRRQSGLNARLASWEAIWAIPRPGGSESTSRSAFRRALGSQVVWPGRAPIRTQHASCGRSRRNDRTGWFRERAVDGRRFVRVEARRFDEADRNVAPLCRGGERRVIGHPDERQPERPCRRERSHRRREHESQQDTQHLAGRRRRDLRRHGFGQWCFSLRNAIRCDMLTCLAPDFRMAAASGSGRRGVTVLRGGVARAQQRRLSLAQP